MNYLHFAIDIWKLGNFCYFLFPSSDDLFLDIRFCNMIHYHFQSGKINHRIFDFGNSCFVFFSIILGIVCRCSEIITLYFLFWTALKNWDMHEVTQGVQWCMLCISYDTRLQSFSLKLVALTLKLCVFFCIKNIINAEMWAWKNDYN